MSILNCKTHIREAALNLLLCRVQKGRCAAGSFVLKGVVLFKDDQNKGF